MNQWPVSSVCSISLGMDGYALLICSRQNWELTIIVLTGVVLRAKHKIESSPQSQQHTYSDYYSMTEHTCGEWMSIQTH